MSITLRSPRPSKALYTVCSYLVAPLCVRPKMVMAEYRETHRLLFVCQATLRADSKPPEIGGVVVTNPGIANQTAIAL